ncbi:ABC transporter substrate-binding protein [Egibacter rhizosphaerae]|uniref:ABC transporter substrate-binding protein n=1 Tax=Egibacter rhizosphaerae TaxID=1670831 RepID=A0A411YC69_9ACTN|nr:ABC transporter substrate-binding protein [Egibacter rhizosphaerae]QBI18800.1 ABC transporter substrate-binding protein [Egibacter rhizosphaerae]
MQRSRRQALLATLLGLLAMMLVACAEDAGDEVGADADPDDAEADDAPDDAPDDADATEGELTEVELVAFEPPSLGAFLPAVIEAQGFDEQHGLDLDFVERPPGPYNTEFGAGQFDVGASGSLMSEAVRVTEGVDVVYLFNVFDYWATVVATTDEIQELPDIEGGTLAGATVATSWAMFEWFAQEEGLDLDETEVQDVDTGGLGTQAQTGRSDAVQMWEPGFTTLMADDPEGVHEVGIPIELWEEEFGFDEIPYLGVAAHQDWVDENEEIIPDLRAVYEDAADWSLDNPAEAAEIIADTIEGGDAEALTGLLEDNDRLGLNVQPAHEVADGIRAVFDAGVEIGYFEEPPSDDVIYEGAE